MISGVFVAQALVVPLWINGAPGSEARRNEPETKPNPWSVGHIYNPTLTVYRPEKNTSGTAIIICPGGGHRELVVEEEGTKPAKYLASIGVTAIVLKYRLAREEGSGLSVAQTCMADGERAMRLVRSRASEWGIKRVGMMGFSAGGEVLSTVAFEGTTPKGDEPDTVDRLSAKPDFGVWIYPGPLGIPKTGLNQPPPGFILVAQDDWSASVCLDLSKQYKEAKVPFELHVLGTGGHGFNMGDRSKKLVVNTWKNRLADWLSDQGY